MNDILKEIMSLCGREPLAVEAPHGDEVYVTVDGADFNKVCLFLHRQLNSPVMTMFAVDDRKSGGHYGLYCAFEGAEHKKWFFVTTRLPAEKPEYPTLSKDIYSAHLFEREMKEMFGIHPAGSPDTRRLHLHDEVWPDGYYPLRKDFTPPLPGQKGSGEYVFRRIEGQGVFEVPVGPVHAGIIGPGHFRFSVAGEPIINLELRLGFTHRGVEKLFEGKTLQDAAALAECVSGDAAFAHSLAFCNAAEKIGGIDVPHSAQCLRALFLELERMYNHAADIGGIAVDVGFSYPQACAAVMKETLLALNGQLTGSRYLKGVNCIGGVNAALTDDRRGLLNDTIERVSAEMQRLKTILLENVSFMDRVDTTGTLSRRIATDLGITGLAARASGIHRDLRRDFPGVYHAAGFVRAQASAGDVLARLKVRIDEFEESARLVRTFAAMAGAGDTRAPQGKQPAGFGLGYVEGWRGPVLYWLKVGASGKIERCKVTDASFRNWQGLSYAVQGNIIPDFPLCNKSFDLSYPGNDL